MQKRVSSQTIRVMVIGTFRSLTTGFLMLLITLTLTITMINITDTIGKSINNNLGGIIVSLSCGKLIIHKPVS